MKKYIEIAFDSRGLPRDNTYVPCCEWCNERPSVDVDHIRGRKGPLLNDPKNLIFVCRECHINKGGFEWKQKAEQIVLYQLKENE